MTYRIYNTEGDSQVPTTVKSSMDEAAAWVVSSGRPGVSYLIKKVEEVDVVVLTASRPWADQDDDSGW